MPDKKVFLIGTTVTLKGLDKPMTVTDTPNEGQVPHVCGWIDENGEFQEEVFYGDSLEEVKK